MRNIDKSTADSPKYSATVGANFDSFTTITPTLRHQQQNDTKEIHGTIYQTLSMESITETSWKGNVMNFDHSIVHFVKIEETNVN